MDLKGADGDETGCNSDGMRASSETATPNASRRGVTVLSRFRSDFGFFLAAAGGDVNAG
jgi:hypothetical protein